MPYEGDTMNKNNYENIIYKSFLLDQDEKDLMSKDNKKVNYTIKLAYIYTFTSKKRPYIIDNQELPTFLGEARPILVVDAEDTNYVREIRTGKLFPIAYITREDVWTKSYLKYTDNGESRQYVVTNSDLPYKRLATPEEVYKYYTVVDDDVIKRYLEPITFNAKILTK